MTPLADSPPRSERLRLGIVTEAFGVSAGALAREAFGGDAHGALIGRHPKPCS